ncbi:deoxyribose-phosphate aldolase [Phlyctema vagabunda]|uniref:deoxyribose-phosphate aldolase n=1 Tax=Phlyctema vagabunda TaxID=108571 RepID=A0ABR4PVQ4_9HELO
MMASQSSKDITVSLSQLAKMIDHSLLHPTMTDDEITAGLETSKKYGVATVCIKPYSIPMAKAYLESSGVGICAVIGFPHGNSTTHMKILEATDAAKQGATEIDMVINIGKALGGDWDYVAREVELVNEAVTENGAILKVIFENDFLQDDHIIKLCQICTAAKAAFIKTSTGYGFVKQSSGDYAYKGATLRHLALMRKNAGKEIQIKAAGGVRTLDELLNVMYLGVTRIGATATAAILDAAKERGIGEVPKEVPVPDIKTLGADY